MRLLRCFGAGRGCAGFALLLALGGAAWAAEPSTLRIGNGTEPETLDPHRASGVSTLNIVRDLYEGLTAIAPDGAVVPAAAQRWRTSDDGLIWTFELRADARWSNGDPVTAADFAAGLRRTVDPATGSGFAGMLAVIANATQVSRGALVPLMLAVDALDERQLRIRLIRPAPHLPSLLSHPACFPVHRASLALGIEATATPSRVISNGAYRLAEWAPQSRVVLERNPRYWNNTQTAIDRVIYLPTEDQNSELKRYRADELDITSTVPTAQAPWLRAHLAAELHLATYLGSYFYGFNLTQPPFRDQPKLREALAMVVDRELIVDKLLHGLAEPAYGFVPPGLRGYTAQQPAWAGLSKAERLAEARRLYAASGYSAEHPLSVEIRYNTQDDNKRIAVVIAAMWKQALGVEVRLVNEEWKVFLQNRRQRRVTQVFRSSWIGDYDDPGAFADILRSTHGRNDSGYASRSYDALLAAAEAESDPQRRNAAYAQAERAMLEDLPILPIYFYRSKHLVKPRVQGWQDNLLDYHYAKDLRLEAP